MARLQLFFILCKLPACNFQDPMVVAVGDIEDARAINIDTVRAVELGF